MSEQTYTLLVKDKWTDVMVEFYENRMLGKNGHVNKEGNDIISDETIEDEVGHDHTTHVGFIKQNNVSSSVDASMAKVVGNVDAGPSSFV